MSRKTESERQEALTELREGPRAIRPGDTLWTVIRDVSRDGMNRSIDLYKLYQCDDGSIDRDWLSRIAARALGYRFDEKREAIRVSGCGMDMGFHVVYSLSYALFPDGFGCIGQGCPSNDHSNGDRNYTVHGAPSAENNGTPWEHWHRDGGYALRQRWL